MKPLDRLTPVFVSLLLTMGFFLHLTNVGQYVHHGQTSLASLISPVGEAVLGAWMAFCAALLVLRRRAFMAAYHLHGWKKAVHSALTFYVAASVPGHVFYLVTGDLRYFTFFPWWFSPIIMIVYVSFIWFLLSLSVSHFDRASHELPR